MYKSGWRVTFAIRVKYADQPLDLANLCFCIGHPAMFRRLGFAGIERCPAPQQTGYGAASSVKLKNFIDPAPGTVVLAMNEANTKGRTPEKALEYITQQIETAQGKE
jgi:hypothetical protein